MKKSYINIKNKKSDLFNNEKNKKVLLVDINDNSIKKMSKLTAHITPNLHRAFSVFIFNKNKMLIQQRASSKYHSPLLWANACCSHPLTDNIVNEANIRLKEELGINKKIILKELFSFIYYANLGNIYEYELDHVLVGEYSESINYNIDEVKNYEWINIDELKKQLVNNPTKFAPWFLISAPFVLKLLNK